MIVAGIRPRRPPDSRGIDLPGGAIFALRLVALIYGLIESSSSGWGSARVIIALAVALAALASFPLIERMRRQPMFDLSLLRKPTFAGGLVAALGMNGSLYAILLYLVLYLQNGLHDSALGTGLRLLVITVAAMATSILAGRLSQYVPIRWLIGLGLGLIGLGLLLMRGLHADTGWTHLILGMAIAGAGSGLVNPPLASTAVGVVQPQHAGMASGINATFRQIGIATSVAVLGSVFDAKIGGATAATVTGQYASALNEVLLIAACIAFVAGRPGPRPDPPQGLPRPRPRCAATRACDRKPQLIRNPIGATNATRKPERRDPGRLSRDRTGHSNTARRARRGGNHRRSGRAPTGRCRLIPTRQCAHDRRRRHRLQLSPQLLQPSRTAR